jgi:hypothetical protein
MWYDCFGEARFSGRKVRSGCAEPLPTWAGERLLSGSANLFRGDLVGSDCAVWRRSAFPSHRPKAVIPLSAHVGPNTGVCEGAG